MKKFTSWQEAVALPGNGTDEAGVPPVFPELLTEIANVTIHNVALGDIVRTPHRVEDVVASKGLPGVRSEQVQKSKLQ